MIVFAVTLRNKLTSYHPVKIWTTTDLQIYSWRYGTHSFFGELSPVKETSLLLSLPSLRPFLSTCCCTCLWIFNSVKTTLAPKTSCTYFEKSPNDKLAQCFKNLTLQTTNSPKLLKILLKFFLGLNFCLPRVWLWGNTNLSVEARCVTNCVIDEMRAKRAAKFAMPVNMKCRNDQICAKRAENKMKQENIVYK